ncbi:hypothetical protein N7489_006763 [Penicillium chrysogenum]|uniref:Uncharacterized protein n=1 Tax=Penicillium chrysogenum TaxID=5076 RepID=A0ABQ8W4F7_PENCH|nr:uncharacterized protein N7489_006763 [Penicillium chrysogenum]KAJ5236672.1 hypothetical protein N7489_006763 [Penicillium chrysogenum]KAJ5255572.1 hypothetical protein N7505_010723 [Penicillium chrysogenum]KAJ5276634.1 hypothetical protein N7524_002787 [Penicillium chrysogenum]KAJ6152623.1 hypothetical protein N7497_006942 [Penicillium chrysogenum]
MQLKPSTLALALSLFVSSTLADGELSSTLVGCDEVSCPKEGINDRCTVEDNTFLGIGLSRIRDVPSPLEGFSLVKGVNVSDGLAGNDNDKPTRSFKSLYYLGTPSDVETRDLSGCVVVFNDAPSKKFNQNGNDVRAASGSCSDVIDNTCIERLTEKATELADEADGNVCTSLERELKSASLDECNGFGNGGNLGNFTVKSLGDLNAVKNSSDCWPIQPKSDQLMEIASVTALNDNTATALYDEAYKITPVLTVFTGNDNSSLVDKTASQLTCLKVVTEEDPSDDEDSSENSAVAVKASGFAAGIAVLAGILALL